MWGACQKAHPYVSSVLNYFAYTSSDMRNEREKERRKRGTKISFIQKTENILKEKMKSDGHKNARRIETTKCLWRRLGGNLFAFLWCFKVLKIFARETDVWNWESAEKANFFRLSLFREAKNIFERRRCCLTMQMSCRNAYEFCNGMCINIPSHRLKLILTILIIVNRFKIVSGLFSVMEMR